mmetsp:Transcript_27983/g.43494  ORF Transcript_27983/g.43494 Transcript_27983/m.43494 type:complete len:591 (+) Transcript_27983:114-1886(+)
MVFANKYHLIIGGSMMSWNSCHAFSLVSSPKTTNSFRCTPFLNRVPVSFLNAVESNGNEGGELISARADDVQSIQALFLRQCDADGLMTKQNLEAVPELADLLKEGDLLPDELSDIWNAAPKFPCDGAEEKIDVDSFTQIYRDIDDLFEDEDMEEDGTAPTSAGDESKSSAVSAEVINGDDEAAALRVRDEKELETVFKDICDTAGLLSREALMGWDEVKLLFDDNLLGRNEFDELFDQTIKSPGTSDQLDVEGFLSFNVALDDLFEFDDEDEERAAAVVEEVNQMKPVITETDLPAGVLFSQLADNDFLVGMEELKRWGELQDMIAEGDLMPIELQNIFANVQKADGAPDKVNEDGFYILHDAIFDLFENDNEDEQTEAEDLMAASLEAKSNLLNMLADLQRREGLSGLECSDADQARIQEAAVLVEASSNNLLTQKDIQPADVAGSWDLLYTSSGMFRYNQGLTGLAGSVPNAEFGGLKQELIADKYLFEVKYVERIAVKSAPENSFDASVNGDWELKKSVSLLTGAPTVIMSIEPEKVEYGPTSTRADHWKSVRSMNLLDISYLDDDLRIMRGNTSTDTIFILQRSK